jgi:hypothetical protein
MKDYPVKKMRDTLIKTERKNVEVMESSGNQASFISFRHSYKSMSCFGGKTYIKSKETRFENGKFESEEFEGTMDQSVYQNRTKELQNTFSSIMSSFLKPFSLLLPFSADDDDEDRRSRR